MVTLPDVKKPNYIQLYACDIGGWLDTDMKINFLTGTYLEAIGRIHLESAGLNVTGNYRFRASLHD